MPHRNPSQRILGSLPLPVEVEEIIIDQLSDDTKALRSRALTCRSWAIRSQLHLFRAIRVKTRAQLDAMYDYFDAHPQRRGLVLSVTMAPDSPKELGYLLGIFPAALLSRLPNIRKWGIQGGDGDDSKTASRPRALSFHKTTLTQLRYTAIEELHLSHIQFASDAEFIRLIGSLRHLRHLRYTHVGVQKHGGLISPNLAARILQDLSTLDIHVQSTEDETADTLVELVQHTLRNLIVRFHPRARWGSSLPTTTRSPVRLKLDSLTFRVEPDGDLSLDSLPDFMLEIFQYVTHRVSTFHRTSAVKELAVHIHVTSTIPLPTASLALRLTKSDHFLDRFRSLHLDLIGQVPPKVQLRIHLPPRTEPRGVLVQGTVLASDNFIFEESYQQQVQYYSEGNVWRAATKSERDCVVALAISPDGKWIASGSRQHAILWNATAGAEDRQSPEMVHEWIAPVDDDRLTRPFAFSPDSRVLVCCTRDPRAFVQVRDVVTGKLLAVFRAPAGAMDRLDSCRASCVWSPNGETLTSVAFIPSQHRILVQVWNAENYRIVSTASEITPFHSPSFLCSPNGRWMACFQTTRSHSPGSPPVSLMPDMGACAVLGAPALLASAPTDCHIIAATFDHTSTRFAAVSSDHVLHVWRLSESIGTKLLHVPMNECPNDPVRLALAFSLSGTDLLSCSGGRGAAFVLTTRDAASGRTLLPRRPAYHCLRSRTAPRCVFSDDGRHLISASEDGCVQLWRAADASFVREVARGGDAPTTFAWRTCGDGGTLAWGTEGGGVVMRPL